jgi:hypothetical protein
MYPPSVIPTLFSFVPISIGYWLFAIGYPFAKTRHP